MFNEYHSLCKWHKEYEQQFELLGRMQALPFPNSSLILCNAFAQKWNTNTKYSVDLDAWELILKKIIMQIKAKAKETGIRYEIHCNYGIGSGMKPVEVEAVHELFESYFNDNDIKLIYHI